MITPQALSIPIALKCILTNEKENKLFLHILFIMLHMSHTYAERQMNTLDTE